MSFARLKRFNLAKDILFKVAVFRLAADQLYLVWSNHHIMMDGWSMGVLMKSLFQNYEAHAPAVHHNMMIAPDKIQLICSKAENRYLEQYVFCQVKALALNVLFVTLNVH